MRLQRPGIDWQVDAGSPARARRLFEQLLYYCFRDPIPCRVVVQMADDRIVPAGWYRLLPERQELLPCAEVGAPGVTADVEGDSWTIYLLAHPPVSSPERDGSRARAVLHRLTVVAAELDLQVRALAGASPLTLGALGFAVPPAGAGSGRPRDELSRAGAVLRLAAPRMVEPLFTSSALRRLEALTGNLVLASRDVGLECRLGAGETAVDLAAAVETTLYGVPGEHDIVRGGTPMQGDWQPLRRLRHAYVASADLQRHTRHLGLEFDLDDPAGALRPPAMFIGLQAGTVQASVLTAARAGLRAMLGGDRDSQRAVERFIDGIPRASTLCYFGCFPSRSAGTARFNLLYTGRDQALQHLADVGLDLHQSRVASAYGSGASIVLAYDVGAKVGERLGIEYLFDGDGGYRRLLDELVGRGLCTPAKRDALGEWSMALQEPAGGGWPEAVSRRSRLSGGVQSVLFFKISHLKVVASRDHESAKAYLQLQNVFAPPTVTASA